MPSAAAHKDEVRALQPVWSRPSCVAGLTFCASLGSMSRSPRRAEVGAADVFHVHFARLSGWHHAAPVETGLLGVRHVAQSRAGRCRSR